MPGPTRGSGALGASGALGTPCLQPLRALLCPSAPRGKHGSPGFPTCHCHDRLLRCSDVVRRPPSHLARAWPWPVQWARRRHPSLSGWPGAAAPWLSLPSGHASQVILPTRRDPSSVLVRSRCLRWTGWERWRLSWSVYLVVKEGTAPAGSIAGCHRLKYHIVETFFFFLYIVCMNTVTCIVYFFFIYFV